MEFSKFKNGLKFDGNLRLIALLELEYHEHLSQLAVATVGNEYHDEVGEVPESDCCDSKEVPPEDIILGEEVKYPQLDIKPVGKWR